MIGIIGKVDELLIIITIINLYCEQKFSTLIFNSKVTSSTTINNIKKFINEHSLNANINICVIEDSVELFDIKTIKEIDIKEAANLLKDNFNLGRHSFNLDISCFCEALAGCGKTTSCIIEIIRSILYKGVKVHEILYLNFTRKGVSDMERDIKKYIELISNNLDKFLDILNKESNESTNEMIDECISNCYKLKCNKIFKDLQIKLNKNEMIKTIDEFAIDLLREAIENPNLKIQGIPVDKIIEENVLDNFEYDNSKNIYLYSNDLIPMYTSIFKNNKFDYFQYYNYFKKLESEGINLDKENILEYFNIIRRMDLTILNENKNKIQIENEVHKTQNFILYKITDKILKEISNNIMMNNSIPLNSVYYFLNKRKDVKNSQIINNIKIIITDEAQDMNPNQLTMIKKICEAKRDIKTVFVGDGKQCIYEWRGAEFKSFIEFLKCQKIKYIVFNMTHRFGEEIKKINNKFFENNRTDDKNDMDVEIKCPSDCMKSCVEKYDIEFDKFMIEKKGEFIKSICNEIEGIRSRGKSEQIMILTRTNYQLKEIYELLKNSTSIKRNKITFTSPKIGERYIGNEARDMLALLDYYSDPGNVEKAIALIRSSFIDEVELNTREAVELLTEKENVLMVADTILDKAKKYMHSDKNILMNVYESIINLYKFVEDEEEYRKNLDLIMNDIISDSTINISSSLEIIDFLKNKAKEKNESDKTIMQQQDDNCDIVLLTIHTSKGAQAKIVYTFIDYPFDISLTSANKKLKYRAICTNEFGRNNIYIKIKKIQQDNEYEYVGEGFDKHSKVNLLEERNLIYVSLTRAREKLVIYYNKSKNNIGSLLKDCFN